MTDKTDPVTLLKRYCEDADQPAFNRFYREQSGRLWRFLRFRGCHEDAAYDLAAETFTRFIQVVCKDLSSPLALLYRIAINLHIDSYRRDKATPVKFDQQAVDNHGELHHGEMLSDQLEAVRYYLAKLPQDEQNLLLMRYWIGLTHREIAGILESPEGTVRRQAAAAVKKIQAMWQEDET